MSNKLSRRAALSGLGAACAGVLLVPDLRSLFRSGASHSGDAARPFARQVPVLGTRVSLVVRHRDERLAEHAIRQATRALFEVHGTMTRHEPSPLTALNRYGAQEPQLMPSSVLTVLERSRELHSATGGLFDATMGRLTRELQLFMESNQRLPRDQELAHHLEGTGWSQVLVDPNKRTISLAHPNLELDFDGIAKGYAVDRAALALRVQGMEHFLVNAGGDLYAAGVPAADEEGWPIGIELPGGGGAAHTLVISDQAVATSGNYFRPRLPDGQVIRHLLNPRLASPTGEFASATVVAKSTMDADAWSTAAFIGKPPEVEGLARKHGKLEVLLVRPEGSVVRLST